MIRLTLILLLLAAALPAQALALDFDEASAVLARTDAHSRVGADGVIRFDARAAGMTPRETRLGRQLVALANRVAQSGGEPRAFAAARPAPALERFMRQAANRPPSPPTARAAYGDNLWTYAVCGWFLFPRPDGTPEQRRHTDPDPAALLRSWGYHPTPGYAGPGWTRPHTSNWWLCGWHTYRDHAGISGNTISEQNYEGWDPRGEPNPEVLASGPWPYATWPAYVYWWHQTH